MNNSFKEGFEKVAAIGSTVLNKVLGTSARKGANVIKKTKPSFRAPRIDRATALSGVGAAGVLGTGGYVAHGAMKKN